MSKYTKANIIGDSINPINGQRVTTFEVTFPRIILPEFNTHKMIEKNFSSSRAVPFNSMVESTNKEKYVPDEFGKNCKGMQSYETLEDEDAAVANLVWNDAYDIAVKKAQILNDAGVHKQWCNRLIEPFQYVKGVCTATDYDNFFWLRVDDAAQPEIYHLARLMKDAYDNSTPQELNESEWHIPYFKYIGDGKYRCIIDSEIHTLDNALTISVSLCAQRSYRKEDASLERAERIKSLLLGGEKKHWSPYGHQATPITDGFNQKGVTHMLKNGLYASGNLIGWVQHRQIMNNPDMCRHNKQREVCAR